MHNPFVSSKVQDMETGINNTIVGVCMTSMSSHDTGTQLYSLELTCACMQDGYHRTCQATTNARAAPSSTHFINSIIMGPQLMEFLVPISCGGSHTTTME